MSDFYPADVEAMLLKTQRQSDQRCKDNMWAMYWTLKAVQDAGTLDEGIRARIERVIAAVDGKVSA